MSPTAPARHFAREDLSKWLDERTLASAQHYTGAVSQLYVSDHELSALVQGSERRPYSVRITFQISRRNAVIANMHCTCHVGRNCKHGGAVLLAALHSRDEMVLQPDLRVQAWVKDFRAALATPRKADSARPREQLFYVLEQSASTGKFELTLRKASPLPDGRMPDKAEYWDNLERALKHPPAYLTEHDLSILRLLWLANRGEGFFVSLGMEGRPLANLLTLMLASGRCLYKGAQQQFLHLADAPAQGCLQWLRAEDGLIRASVKFDRDVDIRLLPIDPPWFIHPASGECGPIDLGFDSRHAIRLLTAPPLRAVDADLVGRALAEILPAAPSPVAVGKPLRAISTKPVPALRMLSLRVETTQSWRGYPNFSTQWMDFAQPFFDYQGISVAVDDEREFYRAGAETVRLVRDREAEGEALEMLLTFGFETVPGDLFPHWNVPHETCLYALESESAWHTWVGRIAPALSAAGWKFKVDDSFRQYVLDVDEITASVTEQNVGWLDVDLQIEVEGAHLALAPLLSELLAREPELLRPAVLESIAGEARKTFYLADGRRLRISMARLVPILKIFAELFGAKSAIRISRGDPLRLQGLLPLVGEVERASIEASLVQIERLMAPDAVQPPERLGVQLRPYQLQGLAWLQALRASGLGGILADDMGLGKTAQTLAHLLIEKQAGRLLAPALVVVPTSLVFNWFREAAQVAPDLRVLVLHGPQRDFSRITEYELVLTTYPLIWRDAEVLLQHEFTFLILDEAQVVKNAQSKAAGIVRKIRATHRLCLTGTPMENHLGELWAQFDFLLPGYLGDAKSFMKQWRTPIEKGGDIRRREILSQRVRPFLLRRRKNEVARDLPTKTQMRQNVVLSGGQRDLYEAVRVAMDEKVRGEVAARGVARSQLVILDALLKLRQICCDPRLLQLEGVGRIKEHAKLDVLMDMLPELIAEGRRVLVFSQFTRMLDLIVEALNKKKMPHVILTGQTQDRERVVERFQSGEVPLFLISLKAGGVGLNLTAADTVIHFDPWWNPAVEDQATDRAHRIGQQRPVFVYKLIVAGSIEERILALQAQKAALAQAVLSGEAGSDVGMTEADIAELFAPLQER